MAIRLEDEYANSTPASASYPEGSFKNETVSGALDGTPFELAWPDDIYGFLQKLLDVAGITPSGSADTVVASDYFDGLIAAMATTSGYVESGAANAYVLTALSGATLDAYIDGMQVTFYPTNASTTASTVNIDGIGVKAIRFADGGVISTDDLFPAMPCTIQYNLGNDRFEILRPGVFHDVGNNSLYIGSGVSKNPSLGAGSNTVVGTRISVGTAVDSSVIMGDQAGNAFTTAFENVVIGNGACRLATTPSQSVIIGNNAGTDLTNGADHVLIGHGAGINLTTADNNVAIGSGSIGAATTSGFNVCVGRDTMSLGNGTFNTVLGDASGFDISGQGNTALGRVALAADSGNISGDGNTAVGWGCLANLTSADNITAVGRDAGAALTTSPRNTLMGYLSGSSITTGTGQNVCIGDQAGRDITTGGNCVFIGADAGAEMSGSNNVCIGFFAGSTNNLTGTGNVFIGASAGGSAGVSSDNVVIGSTAGFSSSGSYIQCVMLGRSAGNTNNGNRNTFVGYFSGANNDTGTRLAFLGAGAGQGNTVGADSTCIGNNAGANVTTGNQNTLIGSGSGDSITTGGNNVCLGWDAGALLTTTSSGNVLIGPSAGAGLAGAFNDQFEIRGTTNVLMSGDFSNQEWTYTNGYNTTVGATNGALLIDNAGLVGRLSSTLRHKMNDKTITNSDWLLGVRPVSYNRKKKVYEDIDGINTPVYLEEAEDLIEHGMIAEEFVEIQPDMVNYDKVGRPDGINYWQVIPSLIHKIQEQHTAIDELRSEIKSMKNYVKENLS